MLAGLAAEIAVQEIDDLLFIHIQIFCDFMYAVFYLHRVSSVSL